MEYVLRMDVNLSKRCIPLIMRYPNLNFLQTQGNLLEWSCNGIFWLAVTLVFIWMANSESLHQHQCNFLMGLLLDIVLVAVLKSSCRRRRPSPPGSMTLGPDKFSFPSGHASRSVFIVCFLLLLSSIPYVLWPVLLAWCLSVCVSRVLTYRHYILDVLGGICLGLLETAFISLTWIDQDASSYIIKSISDFSSDDSE